ncbi:MAG TPA: class I SAM-dependent methyltransferase [Gemmatimonadaceae bacterium]|nr:class I SAM-dependent methyltransferase [Gemmatimonadaceae bacterium]
MNRAYWDAQADAWDDAIFNSLREDTAGVIRRAIRAAARAHASVLDFGCGVGGYLPFLSETFAEVHAVDWSAACVARARHVAGRCDNVRVERNTPAVVRRLRGRFGALVAANVVIHPRRRVRAQVLSTIRSLVAPGGTVLLVVPSLESATYCEAMRRRVASRARSPYDFAPRGVHGEPGVVSIDRVPTKHYTADELRLVMDEAGLPLRRVQRVPYRWSTEGLRVPRALAEPGPWDWLVIAERPRR